MTDMDVTGGRRVYIYHEDELQPGDIAVYCKDFDNRSQIVMEVVAGERDEKLHDAIDASGKQILEDELQPGDIAVYCKDFDNRSQIVMEVVAGERDEKLHDAIDASGKQILGLQRHKHRVVLRCGEDFYYVPYGSDRLVYGVCFVDAMGKRRTDTATQLCEVMAEVFRR